MAVAQFRGDLTEEGLSNSLTDLIRAVGAPSRYFETLDRAPAELAAVLRQAAQATDMEDEGSTDAA